MFTVGFIPTNDKTIRNALIHELKEKTKFSEHTRVIPELTLPNESVRVDVAVVNGIMHGYELKSDVDTLNRLENQVIAYNSIFDKITLVVGKKHVAHALENIPNWWGVTIAKKITNNKRVILIPIRNAETNPSQDLMAITNLLLKTEIIDCLREIGISNGCSNKSKGELCQILISSTFDTKLKSIVRDKLISRKFTRERQAVLSLMTCGD